MQAGEFQFRKRLAIGPCRGNRGRFGGRRRGGFGRRRRLSGGRGVDLVVDSVGTTIAGSIEATGYRGRIVQVGNAGRAEDRRFDLSVLSQMNRSFTGVFFGGALMFEPQRGRPLVERLIGDVANGSLKVVIDRTYPLAEAAAAHAYIESRQAFGRVVLVP